MVNRRDQPIFPPAGGAKLARSIAGSRRVVVDGDSQLPWVGDGDGAIRLYEEFTSGVASVDHEPTEFSVLLFVDIVGSTERLSAVGDRSWRALLDVYEANVRAEIERFGGREVFTKGDEFLVAFDAPARAVRCAWAVSAAAQSYGVEVRAGLHAGEIERRGNDVAGVAVHIGARVASAATANEVLVSRTIVDLLAGADFSFADRGEHTLKGVAGQWRLFSCSPPTSP